MADIAKIHLRFTPAPPGSPAIADYDLSGMINEKKYMRYIVAHEISDKGIPHYHIWLEGDVSEKTARNYVYQHLHVPKGGKQGQTNAYYILKFNEYDKPSPEYVCKDGDIRQSKGFTEAEIANYIEEGNRKYNKPKSDVIIRQAAAEGGDKRQDRDLVSMYLKYMDEVLPKDINEMRYTYTIDMLRASSIKWWRKSQGGLLPQASTYKRFLASAWIEWKELTTRSEILALPEIEKYGY